MSQPHQYRVSYRRVRYEPREGQIERIPLGPSSLQHVVAWTAADALTQFGAWALAADPEHRIEVETISPSDVDVCRKCGHVYVGKIMYAVSPIGEKNPHQKKECRPCPRCRFSNIGEEKTP
jgi:hypothetical protein